MALLDTFPVSLKIAGRRIVVVGGGLEALNKTRLALKTSAEVSVWARAFDAGFDDLPGNRLTLNRREAGLALHLGSSSWLDNAAMIFIATKGEDADFAEAAARAKGIPVNVVDRPERCDFYTPAIVDRAPVSIAIASEGAAPVIARRVRAAIEALLPPELGKLAQLAGSLREDVAARLPDGAARRRFYEKLVEAPEIAAQLADDPETARQSARALLDIHAEGQESGAIAWVGAGPGAEDLLTLRAQRLLQAADIIAHDENVPEAIIQMGRRDAERLALASDAAPTDAAEGGTRLAGLAGAGKRVVRLVAGDVGETGAIGIEIATARRAGHIATLVPGIAATGTGTARTQKVA